MWSRRPLVRLLLEKGESDQALLSSEQRDQWYTVNSDVLEPEMGNLFLPLKMDQETCEFLDTSVAISNSLCLQIYYSMMASILSIVLTKTSINGLLGRGKMFIFSHDQLKAFLGLPDDWSPDGRRLLDIGAGDGAVTKVFASFYGNISVVEASKVMEWRLLQRGFNLLPLDKWQQSGPYDLIAALNLLDRHHDPHELLKSLHKLARECNAHVLLSVVLPLRQFVEFNARRGNLPRSTINTSGTTFEGQANALIQNTLVPAGFDVIRWTKLPYLCEGDLSRAFYILNDAIFLLRAKRYPSSAHETHFNFTVYTKDEL